jgi:hypothetical protein
MLRLILEDMTPELVLSSALRARDEWRYRDVVSLVDPLSLAEQYHMFCDMMRPMTAERFAAHYPELTGEALDAAFTRWREQTAQYEEAIPRTLPGIASYDELIALDAAVFLTRRMEHDDPRAPLVQQLRARGRTVPDT